LRRSKSCRGGWSIFYRRRVFTVAKFPYAFAVARAIYVRLFRAQEYRLATDAPWGTGHPSGSGVLARRLVNRLAQDVETRNGRLAVVLLPHVDRVFTASPLYDQFADALRRAGRVCVIDPRSALRERMRVAGGDLFKTPSKHYSAFASRVIAEAVAAGLSRCGISG
jgi:hypothetical protein